MEEFDENDADLPSFLDPQAHVELGLELPPPVYLTVVAGLITVDPFERDAPRRDS